MKDELNTDLNPFEAPANLWDRVEKGLDAKQTKKRGIIWWQVAAGVALIGGIGYGMISFLSGNSYVQNDWKAEVKLPVTTEDTIKTEPKDTVNEEKEYSFIKIVPLAYGPEVQIDSTTISTPVPLLTVPPSTATMNTSYLWTSGSGAGLSAPTTSISAPLTISYIGNNGVTNSYSSPPPSPTSYGFNGGPVNVPTNGVLNGTYISKNVETKKLVPYKKLKESDVKGDLGEFGFRTDSRSSSSYESIQENAFKPTSKDPLSTFSIDVDGASYSDVRGMINRNNLPDPNAVRLEEFINYFPYDYPEPASEHPFSVNTELAVCPWNPSHQLLKVGIKGESIEKTELPTNNLVFLLDVSGSMNNPEKLELLKKGFRLLVNELREEDRVAIAVYAGAAGLVLPPTSGANKDQILDALNKLSAGGSTAGGQGINLAYATAQDYFDPNGNNRIILATDGDFNVGVSGNDELVKLIEEKRKSGVFLTVLGFGHDNFQSDKMEKIANNGNGNFSFIDNILEAKKVLVTEMGATLKTIAKDVKIQVEFNPNYVSSYRLLGYENRMLEHQDFANDTIDAGELGTGHTVTAVYELIPPGAADAGNPNENETELKYSKVELKPKEIYAAEIATVKFRYKEPDGSVSKLIEETIITSPEMKGSPDFEFIQAVIEFGLILRQSQYAGDANFDSILERASQNLGDDDFGYRREFMILVEKAKMLADPVIE